MIHCVQFSTGIGSAEVAVRVQDIAKDEDRLVLLTADTMVEDEDNWRFAKEVVEYLSPRWEWIIIRDGRTPMQVGRDRKVVPSDRMAVCSQILKRDALNKWIKHNCDPADSIIYLGFDWTEPHRHHRAEPLWLPYKIDSPLMREPYIEKPALLDKYRAMGITPPPFILSRIQPCQLWWCLCSRRSSCVEDVAGLEPTKVHRMGNRRREEQTTALQRCGHAQRNCSRKGVPVDIATIQRTTRRSANHV